MMVRLRKIIFSSLLAPLFLFGSGRLVKVAKLQIVIRWNLTRFRNDVIQVMLIIVRETVTADRYSQTPKSFTIGDQLPKRVSLAATVFKCRLMGSSINRHLTARLPIVANGTWAKSLYDCYDNVYALNTEGKVTGNSGSLANYALVFDGHTLDNHYAPPFNMLMQIIASANNATTVDLTGVTSEVKDTTLAQSLISLFQTPRLTSINTLLLGSDNLTDGFEA